MRGIEVRVFNDLRFCPARSLRRADACEFAVRVEKEVERYLAKLSGSPLNELSSCRASDLKLLYHRLKLLYGRLKLLLRQAKASLRQAKASLRQAKA